MSDTHPSTRRQIANRFATFIINNDLANPFGGEVYEKETGEPRRKYYAVDLAVPGTDGTVSIYSPRFVLINMKGPRARGGSDRVYDSERNAMNFLRLLLVEHRVEEALAVPTKARKAA